jgi:hypothetical protein
VVGTIVAETSGRFLECYLVGRKFEVHRGSW